MDKSSINSVYRILAKKIGEPKTELNYRNPFTFLVSVVLSAQATDKSVNAATKDLFKIVFVLEYSNKPEPLNIITVNFSFWPYDFRDIKKN